MITGPVRAVFGYRSVVPKIVQRKLGDVLENTDILSGDTDIWVESRVNRGPRTEHFEALPLSTVPSISDRASPCFFLSPGLLCRLRI